MLNGLAGPACMAAPSLISATWFPASQRTTATSIIILSGNVGFALGFVIGIVTFRHFVLSSVVVRVGHVM